MKISTVLTNYLLRHIQVMLFSLGQLWRQPLASLMTVTVIGIALALPAGLYVLLQNMNTVSAQWDDSNQISLFLQQSIPENQIKQLATDLAGWPDIASTDFQSAQHSLDEFRQLSGLGELLDSLPTNPLPALVIIYPEQSAIDAGAIAGLLSRLQALPQVEYAQLDMEWLQRLRSINQTVHRGISILSILLSLSVLLIIGNTIRLAILSRESEIRVMKLVGATDRFVRRPFLYTGFWYGLTGGILAWLTLQITLGLLNGPIDELITHYGSAFNLQWFSSQLFFILPFIGCSLGVSGAWLAVGRHIHMIEPD